MQVMRRALVGLLLALSVLVYAQDGPQAGSHIGAQAAADILRETAGSDAAFIAGDLIKDSFSKDDLATMIQPPNGTDNIVVLILTGEEIKRALERSVSLYPQRNPSFLQISGIEAAFNKNNAPGQRIVSIVTSKGLKVEDKKTYTVAMPASLGRGGLGYFKIWDTSKISRTMPDTVESALKGKRYADSLPRWSVVG